MKASLSLLVLATLLTGGAVVANVPAPVPAAAPPATLAALNQQFAEALQQQDLTKATACLAKNARLLFSTNTLSGRDSLSAYWLKPSFANSSNLQLTPLQTGGDAQMGYATGYYTVTIKPASAYPKGGVVRGSFLTLSRKEGSAWQVFYLHLAEEPVKANP